MYVVKNQPDTGTAVALDGFDLQATTPDNTRTKIRLLLLVPIDLICRHRSLRNNICTCPTVVLTRVQFGSTTNPRTIIIFNYIIAVWVRLSRSGGGQ